MADPTIPVIAPTGASTSLDSALGPRPSVPVTRRRVRTTNTTWYLVMVLLFVLLGAVNYQSNAAYLVLAVVGATAVMSLLHAWRNLQGVRLVPGRTFPVFAGEPLRAQVQVEAGGRERWALVIDAPEVEEDDGVPVPYLPTEESTTIELVLPPRRRGRHTLERIRLASVHPLGLLAVMHEVPAQWTWIVYPTPVVGSHERDHNGDDHLAGGRSSSTGDFHGHRPYLLGEPHRRIDWRAVARGRPLLLKDYTIGGAAECWIDWDDDRIGDTELHLSVLCGRVVAAERQGRRYGLRLPELTIPIGQGDEHRHACLEALALFEVRT
jgi:uncharacterized protein (DUF58 family)